MWWVILVAPVEYQSAGTESRKYFLVAVYQKPERTRRREDDGQRPQFDVRARAISMACAADVLPFIRAGFGC